MPQPSYDLLDIVRVRKQIGHIRAAVQQLESQGLRREALVYLILGAVPKGPRGGRAPLTAKQVSEVLDGIANLEDFMFDKPDSTGTINGGNEHAVP